MTTMDSAPSGYEVLAQRFLRFADAEYRNASPLYEHLARSVANDTEMLALAAHAAPEQPVPHLFFAVIHFLLLQGHRHPLAQFYPSLTLTPEPPQHAYPAFQDFCHTHLHAIRHQLTTRLNQTNEVGRCAYLMPAFTFISGLAEARPLALVEIGTSAGLNLQWDHYGYHYGAGVVCGNLQSPVQLSCTLRGAYRPPLPRQMPQVGLKIGVDLHIVEIRDPDEALWLQALLWPEQRQRAALLRHAIDVTREQPPQLQSGDGVAMLPGILDAIPQDTALCVFHTHVLNQFSAAARDRLAALLDAHAATRNVYRLSAEWLSGEHPQLELTAWQKGQRHQWRLAYCHHHGAWLEWLDPGKA